MSKQSKLVIPFKNHKPVVTDDYYGAYTLDEYERIDPVFKLECIGYDHVEVEDYDDFYACCKASDLFKSRYL